MKRIKSPRVTKARPPTLTNPLFVNILHSLVSFSLGSGLCNQSSFSTSSGNSKSPAEGSMLYFSDTVCVFTLSSSLPALEGARESANGSTPYILLSRLFPSELKLVLRDGVSTGEPGADSSSRNLCVLDRDGGMSSVSDESRGPPLYNRFTAGLFRPVGAVGVLDWGIKERADPEFCLCGCGGRSLIASFVRRLD